MFVYLDVFESLFGQGQGTGQAAHACHQWRSVVKVYTKQLQEGSQQTGADNAYFKILDGLGHRAVSDKIGIQQYYRRHSNESLQKTGNSTTQIYVQHSACIVQQLG